MMPLSRLHGLSALFLVGACLLLLFSTFSKTLSHKSIHASLSLRNDKLGQSQWNSTTFKTSIPQGQRHQRDILRLSNHGKEHLQASQYIDTRLYKRALTWNDALRDGKTWTNKLRGTRQQSPWGTLLQARRSGWSVQKPEVEDGTDGYLGKDGKGNDGPYKDLGINRRNGLYIEADQDKDFDNCHGKNNPASYAEFWNSYNVPGKTIVALHNYSPTVRLLEDPSAKPVGERLPDVNKWSDITFIVWANQAKAATGSLKYVFRNNVITASTRGIMNVAAHRAENPSNPNGHMDATIPFTKEWPGHKFNRGSVEFQALIGTPHGKGAAALLVDHPTEFPGKYIESITIFTMESAPQLLFTFTGPAN